MKVNKEKEKRIGKMKKQIIYKHLCRDIRIRENVFANVGHC